MISVALLFACLSRYLDAPYVLATGLPAVTELVAEGDYLVATTEAGNFRIDGAGTTTPWRGALPPAPSAPGQLPANVGTTLAIAQDSDGKVYFVRDGPAPALFRVDREGAALVAEWVGPVTAMTFGGGGLLPAENLYLARSDGIVEYLRPP